MSRFIGNKFYPGKVHNYLIASNITNAFAVGNIGSSDDFFLVGAIPEDDSGYPLLTGNILDSEGNVLFRLVKNMLVVNPGGCSKIYGNQVGYEIYDSAGKLIFKVQTLFEKLSGLDDEGWVTTLTGNFYDKSGKLVFAAKSGDNEELEVSTKYAFGYVGNGFAFISGPMSDTERLVSNIAMQTHGAVYEAITGEIENATISLDGKILIKAKIRNCTINIHTGDFIMLGSELCNNQIKFLAPGPAANIATLMSENK